MAKKLFSVFLIFLMMNASGCLVPRSPNKAKKSSQRVQGKAGKNIQNYHISIDANYDARLDNLLPGYKLMSVIIRNSSLSVIPMDVRRDRWTIIGEKGQSYRAITSLKIVDAVAWRELPEKLRTMIDYPDLLPINYNVTFDILLPRNAKLQYFKTIRFYSANAGQEFILEKEY